MSQGKTASAPYTMKNGVYSGGAIRRGPQPPEYGVELLYPVRVRFLEGPH